MGQTTELWSAEVDPILATADEDAVAVITVEKKHAGVREINIIFQRKTIDLKTIGAGRVVLRKFSNILFFGRRRRRRPPCFSFEPCEKFRYPSSGHDEGLPPKVVLNIS